MEPSAWPDKIPVPAALTTMEQTKLSVPYRVWALLVLQWATLTFPSAQPNTRPPSEGQAIQVTAEVCMNLLQITFFSPKSSPIL